MKFAICNEIFRDWKLEDALAHVAKAHAFILGRPYVIPEDVKAVAVPALAHRLSLRPELWVQRLRPQDIVTELLDQVPTPKAEIGQAAEQAAE